MKEVELVEVCGIAKLWVLERRAGIQLENLRMSASCSETPLPPVLTAPL